MIQKKSLIIIYALVYMILLSGVITHAQAIEHILSNKLHSYSMTGAAINYSVNRKSDISIFLYEINKGKFKAHLVWDNVNLFGKATASGNAKANPDDVINISFHGTFDVSLMGGWPAGSTSPFTLELFLNQRDSLAYGKYIIHEENEIPEQTGRVKFANSGKPDVPYLKNYMLVDNSIKKNQINNPSNAPTLNGWFTIHDDLFNYLPQNVTTSKGILSVNKESSEALLMPLNFFNDEIALLRITDEKWAKNNLALYFLFCTKQFLDNKADNYLIRLDGKLENEVIDITNTIISESLTIDEGNVIDFTHYMCFFIRNPNNPKDYFYIPEDYTDPFIRKIMNRIWQLDNKISFTELYKIENDHYHLKSSMLWRNAFYNVWFEVNTKEGSISMVRDYKILEGITGVAPAPID